MLWQSLLAPLGWPRAVCHLQALEKLLCAVALPRRLGGWPGIKGVSCRNPGASLHLKPQEDSGKKFPGAAAKVKQGKQRTDYSVFGVMGTFSPASFFCTHSLCPRPPWYHLVTELNTGNQTLGVTNLSSSFSSLFYRQEFSERHVRNEEHIPIWGLNTTFPWIQEFVPFFFCILDIRTIVICKAREYYYSSFPFYRGIICIFCKTLPAFEVCTEKSYTKC